MANVYTDLGDVIIPAQFGTAEDSGDLTNDSEAIYFSLKSSVETNWGASQFVIMNDNWDYVYKIPFDGTEWYCEEEEEYYFDEFSRDYCKLAADIYAEAEDAGVAPLFASMTVAGYSKNGFPIYIQPKAVALNALYGEEREKYSATEDSVERAKKIRETKSSKNEYLPFDNDWVANVLDFYGEEMLEKLLAFVENLQLNDFHTGNYGYSMSGKPILFDYCGFYE